MRRELEIFAETGEFPSHFELLEDTHKRKCDGLIIDAKTQNILDEMKIKVNEKISEICDDNERELTKDEMDDIFKSIVPSKRGRRYGMGSVSKYLEFPSSLPPSPAITGLQGRLQSTQDELVTTKETVHKQAKQLEKQEELLNKQTAEMKAMREKTDRRLKAFEVMLKESQR